MRCRSAGTCRKVFAIKSGTPLAGQVWGALVTGLCVWEGFYIQLKGPLINKSNALFITGHWEWQLIIPVEKLIGWVTEAYFPEMASLDFEEMKRGSTFSLGNWMVNCTLLFEFAPMMLVQILQALEAMEWLLREISGRKRQDESSWWHGEFPWKWKNTGSWLSRRNVPFSRGKLGCCHPCELQLCELGPIKMLLCQGLGWLRECPMLLADLEGTQVPLD